MIHTKQRSPIVNIVRKAVADRLKRDGLYACRHDAENLIILYDTRRCVTGHWSIVIALMPGDAVVAADYDMSLTEMGLQIDDTSSISINYADPSFYSKINAAIESVGRKIDRRNWGRRVAIAFCVASIIGYIMWLCHETLYI